MAFGKIKEKLLNQNQEEDCEVFVLFGGQEFDFTKSVYLTSRHFWNFLADFAIKSKSVDQI